MNDQRKKELSKEVNDIIESRFEFIKKFYKGIRDPYNNPYDLPQLDPLRHEICLCIMFGMCQAAITLTNHLLESLLKYALIIHHSTENKQDKKVKKGESISSFKEFYKDGIIKYNNANLDTTINRACTVGLITKDQKQKLIELKNKFRNAYSHSDKKKTFGKNTVSVTGFVLEEKGFKIDEKNQPEIWDFMIGQGLIQAKLAQNDAPNYFHYIDDLVREIRDKLFDEMEEEK